MTLILLVVLLSLGAICVVLAPFFAGNGGLLQDASAADSVNRLEERRKAILRRWLDEEQQSAVGMITSREWELRQVYLTSRYVDATRRMEWLATQESSVGGEGSRT